jgi:hypothetical protein
MTIEGFESPAEPDVSNATGAKGSANYNAVCRCGWMRFSEWDSIKVRGSSTVFGVELRCDDCGCVLDTERRAAKPEETPKTARRVSPVSDGGSDGTD